MRTILLSLIMACAVIAKPTALETERARAAAADAIALTQPESTPTPSPTPPTPAPQPNPPAQICQRCNGTGHIKPDGRIEIPCPDCGGTGRITSNGPQFTQREREYIAAIQSLLTRQSQLEQQLKAMPARPTVPQKQESPTRQAAPVPLPPSASGPPPLITKTSDLKRAVVAQKKPGLVIISGDGCIRCAQFERNIIEHPMVAALISDRCVVAHFNWGRMSQSERDSWKATSIPVCAVIPTTFDEFVKLPTNVSVNEFYSRLVDALDWAKRSAEQPPVNAVAEWVWVPRASSVSGGSAGGTYRGWSGGSSGGGWQTAPAWSGGSAGGYTGGSAGGVAVQWVQPAWPQPTYYAPLRSIWNGAPTYGVWGSGGLTITCDQFGCHYQ